MTGAQEVSRKILLGDTFRLVGWIGFWVQLLLGALPILIGLWVVTASSNTSTLARSINWAGMLATASVVILLFTILWSLNYVRIGRRMRSSEHGRSQKGLSRAVGFGVAASCIGIAISAVVLLVEATQIVIAFLQAPQGGVPVIQTSADNPYWISAVDAISLLGVSIALSAEVIVLVLGLYLLLRIATARAVEAETGMMAAQ